MRQLSIRLHTDAIFRGDVAGGQRWSKRPKARHFRRKLGGVAGSKSLWMKPESKPRSGMIPTAAMDPLATRPHPRLGPAESSKATSNAQRSQGRPRAGRSPPPSDNERSQSATTLTSASTPDPVGKHVSATSRQDPHLPGRYRPKERPRRRPPARDHPVKKKRRPHSRYWESRRLCRGDGGNGRRLRARQRWTLRVGPWDPRAGGESGCLGCGGPCVNSAGTSLSVLAASAGNSLARMERPVTAAMLLPSRIVRNKRRCTCTPILLQLALNSSSAGDQNTGINRPPPSSALAPVDSADPHFKSFGVKIGVKARKDTGELENVIVEYVLPPLAEAA